MSYYQQQPYGQGNGQQQPNNGPAFYGAPPNPFGSQQAQQQPSYQQQPQSQPPRQFPPPTVQQQSQPQQPPYGLPPQQAASTPYGQPPQQNLNTPYGQPPQQQQASSNPYGQPQQQPLSNPYGQPQQNNARPPPPPSSISKPPMYSGQSQNNKQSTTSVTSQQTSQSNVNSTTSVNTNTTAKGSQNKLASFLADCLSIGTLRGFKHFDTYLRGREELLFRVHLKVPTHGGEGGAGGLTRSESIHVLARSASKILLRSASTARLGDQYYAGLPPASPSSRELEKDPHKVAFLIAGYARYKCPYVWLRSNHQKLIKSPLNSPGHPMPKSEDAAAVHDQPVRLSTIVRWSATGAPTDPNSTAPTGPPPPLSDILEEIIHLTLHPNTPPNPFALEREYFETCIGSYQAVLETAAALEFLRKIAVLGYGYTDLIISDIEFLSSLHFKSLQTLLIDGAICQPWEVLNGGSADIGGGVGGGQVRSGSPEGKKTMGLQGTAGPNVGYGAAGGYPPSFQQQQQQQKVTLPPATQASLYRAQQAGMGMTQPFAPQGSTGWGGAH